ncbi:uncharacterized protein TNIN_300051 [Trichonephila inaurata madagascariensis]|uniref:Uncharacterized protein n=1 Tax=Trichonephila inaurata madagascariensis TaxID=2747483 RepID=A0A8X6XBW6_9ARAC|nr:uncharacterized protein TNIN_300051 [Trichonephila inaurata madagascariensis]
MTPKIPSSVDLLSETSIFTKLISESDRHGFRSDSFTLTFTSLSYVSSMTTVFSPLVSKEPLSIESDFPKPLATSTLYSVLSSQYQLPPLTPPSAKELLSIKSDHPEQSTLTMLLTPLLPSYVTSSPKHWQTKVISSSSIIKEPRSIETDEMLQFTRTVSSSIASHSDALLSLKSHYETPQIYPKDLDSTKTPVPSPIASDALLSLKSRYETPQIYPKDLDFTKIPGPSPMASLSDALLSLKSRYETPQIHPKDISLDSTKIKLKPSSYIPSSFLASSVFSRLQPTLTDIKIKDPLSIESEFPKPKITSFLQSSRSHLETSFRPMRPQFETSSSAFYHLQSSMTKLRPTTTTMLISSVQTELSPTLVEGITTPEDTDTILVSILPVSSFLNINQTRNATVDSGPPDDTHSEQTFPTRNTDLFKNNHYWVLTDPEFDRRYFAEATGNRVCRRKRRNLSTFRHRCRIPAFSEIRTIARVFGYHAIVKAKPYRPPSDDISRPVGSPLPVLAIVGGVLLGLLVIFCCFCVYCRCCKPKPAPLLLRVPPPVDRFKDPSPNTDSITGNT